jgi:hypothetical protein
MRTLAPTEWSTKGGVYIAKILVGEDESDIAFQFIGEGEQCGVLVFLAELLDHKADHSVLANEHFCLATHGHTDLPSCQIVNAENKWGRELQRQTWCIWLEVTLSSSTTNMRE